MVLSIIMILSYFNRNYMREIGNNNEVEMPTPEDYAIYACTKDPMTYIVEIKIHTQQQVAEAIQSVYNKVSDEKLGLKASLLSYFGTIFDDINEMLLKYKVQIHLNLDAPIMEEFMTDINFDKSCELADPVIERTTSAYMLLKSKYFNSIGLHLFVWVCPKAITNFNLQQKIDNDNCGRILGIIWEGTEEGRTGITKLIIEALTENTNSPATEDKKEEKAKESKLCGYVEKCVARNPTDIGEKIYGETYMNYTDEYPPRN